MTSRWTAGAAGGIALLSIVVACGSFEEGSSSGEADGGAGAGGDGGASSAGCPNGKGPTMVNVDGKLCIDSTEVTIAQYKEFLDAMGGSTGTQITACSANGSFHPDNDAAWKLPLGKERYPITQVDWCDAYAYCAWAGKRLCGRIGSGEPVAPDDFTNAEVDEWYYACSKGGTRKFAYGDAFDRAKCNVELEDGGDGRIREVKSFPACEGGYPGIFDMSGNVLEWINSCESDDPAASCRDRSSGFFEGENVAGCGAGRSHDRTGFLFHIGIRCCATVQGP